jgi:hypothetical protein
MDIPSTPNPCTEHPVPRAEYIAFLKRSKQDNVWFRTRLNRWDKQQAAAAASKAAANPVVDAELADHSGSHALEVFYASDADAHGCADNESSHEPNEAESKVVYLEELLRYQLSCFSF